MSSTDLQAVKQGLVAAGVEIYRTRPTEVQIAERVRLHIMDSGIRVRIGPALSVTFTARSQRSDFPSVHAEELFERVRARVGAVATERGFEEEGSKVVEVRDPMEETRILDTWHEVTYVKAADGLDALIDEVRWALTVEKYVGP